MENKIRFININNTIINLDDVSSMTIYENEIKIKFINIANYTYSIDINTEISKNSIKIAEGIVDLINNVKKKNNLKKEK